MRSRKIIENEKRRKDFSKVLLADWRSFIALVYSVEAIACSGLRGCFASLQRRRRRAASGLNAQYTQGAFPVDLLDWIESSLLVVYSSTLPCVAATTLKAVEAVLRLDSLPACRPHCQPARNGRWGRAWLCSNSWLLLTVATAAALLSKLWRGALLLLQPRGFRDY